MDWRYCIRNILMCLVMLMTTKMCQSQMQVLHSWRTADFHFPSIAAKEAMIRAELFIPENIAILDVDVWPGQGHGRKVFVTMPRFKKGTPATLATVEPNNILTPYPEWSWHREGNCDGMTSVFRVQVDECGRLWVLDSATIEIFSEKSKKICRPQVLTFNLNTDKLIGRYHYPENVIDDDSLLVTIAVDTRGGQCHDTFVYAADVTSFKLVVFDTNRQKSWRIASNYFYPYPLYGSFDISGSHFDLMDGILGLALGPLLGNDRRLYFHSLASVRESWVATSVLRNASLFNGDANGSPTSFHVSSGVRPSQSAAEAMTRNGIMFFGLLSNNSVACWNSRFPYSEENIITVAQNQATMQFASGVKIVDGKLWMLTSSFQNFMVGNLPNKDRVSFRILTGTIENLVRNTKCLETQDLENEENNQNNNNIIWGGHWNSGGGTGGSLSYGNYGGNYGG